MTLKMFFLFAVCLGLCILSILFIGLRNSQIKYAGTNVSSYFGSTGFGEENLTWGRGQHERWKRFYGEATCEDNPMRRQLKKLLSFWVEFAKAHQIGYTIMWGALLGIARVNDLLPWDHDIDILIDYKDLLKLKGIVEKPGTFNIYDGNVHIAIVPNLTTQHSLTMYNRTRHSCFGEIVTKTADPCSFQEPLSRILLSWWFIDVYHYYDEGQQILTIPEGKRFVMNKTDVFPLRNCSIMGLYSLCPSNPSRLLENWYGKGYLDKSQYKCMNGKWHDENGKEPKKDWRL